MKNNFKYLLLGFLIILFLFPRPASADFLGILDVITASLEGVEETAGPTISLSFILFTFLYAIGIVLCIISGSLLQHVISHQAEWISVQPENSSLVASGFSFTSGLANLFLVLIFIVIAFAFILRIESFQAKKSLPKLIAVALLLNFALVFIGMVLDITNIFYNNILEKMTVQEDGTTQSVLSLTLDKLVGPIWKQLTMMISWIVTRAIAFTIPGGSVAAQLAINLGFQALILPNIAVWVGQLLCLFSITGIFFFYTLLFAFRVFIIQILAILSPLAFLCLILPQTQKYWQKWLSQFVEWLILGIMVLFLLVLGLRSIDKIMPPGTEAGVMWPIVDWVHITDFLIYYFFLFIYLIVMASLSKKTAPALADALISGVKAGAMSAIGVVAPMGISAGREIRKSWQEPGAEGSLKERIKEGAERWAEEPAPELKGLKSTLAPAYMAGWAVRRGLGRSLAIAPKEAEIREIQEGKKLAEKTEIPERLVYEVRSALSAGNLAKALGLISKGIEKGKFKKELESQLTTDEAIKLAQYANKTGATSEAKRIGLLFANRENVVNQMGFELTEEDKEKYQGSVAQKLLAEIKTDEIPYLAEGFWNSPAAQRAMQLFWGGPQINKAAQTFERPFVEAYMEPNERELRRIRELPDEEAEREYRAFIHTNPRKARFLETNAAQETGLGSLFAGAPQVVRKKYSNINAILAEGIEEEPSRIERPPEQTQEGI